MNKELQIVAGVRGSDRISLGSKGIGEIR